MPETLGHGFGDYWKSGQLASNWICLTHHSPRRLCLYSQSTPLSSLFHEPIQSSTFFKVDQGLAWCWLSNTC